MKHQKTYDNFYSNMHKSVKSELSNTNQGISCKEKPKVFHKRAISFSKINKKFKCNEHNRNYYKYCIQCKDDICPQCYNNNHFIHDNINYEDISLNKKQMKLFIKEYNEYIKIYTQILVKIKEWQERFTQTVADFDSYMKKNVIDIISNMINNYDINNINYNTIIEYRTIFSLLLEKSEENVANQKMIKLMKSYINLKNYNSYQYIDLNQNLSDISKDVLSLLNASINKGNFLQQGNNIIKFLYNIFPLFSNDDNYGNIEDIDDIDKNNKKDEKKNFCNYKKKSVVMKNNKSSNNILDSSRNFRKLLYNNIDNVIYNNNKNIYEKKKPFDKKKNGEIFLEKEEIPIFSHKSPVESKEDSEDINSSKNKKNLTQKKWNNLYLTKTYTSSNINKYNPPDNSICSKIGEKQMYMTARESNPLWKSTNFFQTRYSDMLNDNDEIDEYDDDINIDLHYKSEKNSNSSLNKRPIIFNNNINNFNNINNINSKNNYINNYSINTIYKEKNKKCNKVYTHKKFSSTLTGLKNVNLINKSQLDKNSEGTYNTIDYNYYDTYTSYNTISMTDGKIPNSYREPKSSTASKKNAENENINNFWKIKKVKEFQIDINKDINIGFELGNSECKIGIINQDTNCIELWVPYESSDSSNNKLNKLGVPTLISFKDKNDNIIIGENAEELKISNPGHTIFNFMKYIGKNSDEIDGKKELWSYKLYNNVKNGKPYVKGNNNEYKTKVYNFEDLLSLYLRKLFELLFSKFKIKNDKKINNLLKINLIVTVPNDFNYFQRKVIEKIFLTQLFPKKLVNDTMSNYYSEDNKKNNNKNNMTQLYVYGKYNIQIKNIKIENSSNVGYLYLFQKQIENNFNNFNKKVILIHIDGGSVNISLISTLINNTNSNNDFSQKSEKDHHNKNNEEYINKYEIKDIKGTTFGEEDLTDAFVNSCLSDFTEKIRNECMKTPSALAKLRKSCETAKKYFYKTGQTEIKIQKLYDNIDLNMTLNKNDYERACTDKFQAIIELIKDLITEVNISEKEIDDIIFIGNTTNVNIIRQKISKIFKSKNNELFNKLANNIYFENDINKKDYTNDDYIAIGASLQCFNLYENKFNNYKYIEITPISFGIEGLEKKMNFVIKRGSCIPIQVKKFVKIRKPVGDCIGINVYEGEDENVNNNRLISRADINIKNFRNEKKGKDYVEVLIQFIIDNNFDLNVFILDAKTLRRKVECIINIDIVQGQDK